MLYLLCMTLAGSTMFILYMITSRIFKSYWISRKFYFLLKMVLFYFLIPLEPLEDIYWTILTSFRRGIFYQYSAGRISQRTSGINYVLFKNVVGITYPNIKMAIQVGILCFILFVFLIILIIRTIKFMRFRRTIQLQIRLSNTGNEEIYQKITELKEKYKIKRKVDLCILPEAEHCTIGIRRPVIILNGLPENTKDLELILCHEMVHIKYNDFLFRILADFVKSIYWFNPLAHFLEHELVRISELACDESVLMNASDEERKYYATLLAKQKGRDTFRKWAPSLAEKNVQKRERIERIMKKRVPKKLLVILTTLLMGVMIFGNSLNALAYHGVETADIFSENKIGINASGEETFVPDNVEGGFGDRFIVDNSCEEWFIDENGNVYPVMEEGDSPNSICPHEFIHGTIQKHSKHLNGSCTVYIYDGQRCIRCGHLIYGQLISTTEYVKCPH